MDGERLHLSSVRSRAKRVHAPYYSPQKAQKAQKESAGAGVSARQIAASLGDSLLAMTRGQRCCVEDAGGRWMAGFVSASPKKHAHFIDWAVHSGTRTYRTSPVAASLRTSQGGAGSVWMWNTRRCSS